MSKTLLCMFSSLRKTFFITALIIILFSCKNSYSAPGDTTWVTTFNQNFQNWATEHYASFSLPDTNTHYKQILMYYTIGCPAAGCDPWDRLGWIRLHVDTNTYYEIARIITPYNIVGGGYPGQCVFVIDVTDYMPLLHDTVRLGSYIESWIGGTRGWLVTVKFAYIEGEIQDKPFKVINLWQDNHIVYGEPTLPPEDHLMPQTIMIDPVTSKAKVRINNTGHGQGNTENAAEFSFKTHYLLIGSSTIPHVLWRADCNVNPCSPQGGTWQYARAGWCPGASVIPFETDATSDITPGQNITINYDLDSYVNLCRPLNTSCINGQTCADCQYNNNGHTEPHYTVQGQLILYKPNPFASVEIIGTEIPAKYNLSQNFPNPFNPTTKIKFDLPKSSNVKLSVYDIQGKLMQTLVQGVLTPGSYRTELNASNYPSGIYVYRLETEGFSETKRMMLIK